MSDFINDLTSLHFWLAVIFVGVTLEVIGHLLGKGVDRFLSRSFRWWRSKAVARREKRQTLVVELRADTHKQIQQMLRVAFNFGLGLIGASAGVALLSPVATSIILQGQSKLTDSVATQTKIICLVASSFTILAGFACFGLALRGAGLLVEAYDKSAPHD